MKRARLHHRPPIWIRIGLVLMLIGSLGFSLGISLGCSESRSSHKEESKSPPRLVLLIVIDTLRADSLLPEDGIERAPNIRRFAERSATFENVWATSSWTRPSMASLMTSRYPTELGIHGGEDALPPGVPTIATLLRDHDYQTIAVSSNDNITRSFGFDAGFDHFVMAPKNGSYADDVSKSTAKDVTQLALRALQESNTEDHVFLYVHYMDPHQPYLPHPELMSRANLDGRFDGSRRDLRKVEAMDPADLKPEDRERIRDLYRGEVLYCDMWIGKLLDALTIGNLMEDALVILTADHGEAFWEHKVLGHALDLYEETLQVPLIISHREAKVHNIDTPISLLDLAPTILDFCEIPIPENAQGDSLKSTLMGEGKAPLKSRYAEINLRGKNFDALVAPLVAPLIDGDDKIIRRRGGEETFSCAYELYRLSEDPLEIDNRVDSDPDRLELMKIHLESRVKQIREGSFAAGGANTMSAEERQALIDLGYIEDDRK